MKYTYRCSDQEHTVELVRTSSGYRASLDGREHQINVIRAANGELTLTLDGRAQTVYWAADGLRRWVFVDGKTYELNCTAGGKRIKRGSMEQLHAGENLLVAPMPGLVRAVQVNEGDNVAKGQTLFVLEAMKMEIRVQAPHDGRLARLLVKEGQSVEREQVLGELT